MSELLKLPVGIDNFEKIRKEKFYYVDKTQLIEQLLEQWGEVNLFTRPRRFGKTLNMSMFQNFFEIGADKTLFDGLYISGNQTLCEEYMGKFPVIFLSLKGVDGLTFGEARQCFNEMVGREASRFSFLADSEQLTKDEKKMYLALVKICDGEYSMSGMNLRFSLKVLSQLLYKHYGKKTVILIDEYDVPLDKAFQHGYYKEMVSLIRGIFGEALKTNNHLQFAILTGCLRVSKESIFTGLNNFKVYPLTKVVFDECFGFTDEEVKEMLHYYQQDSHYDTVKEWYDGYRFGKVDVYCPWDVINYCDEHLDDPMAEPQNYWSNTSGNDVIKHFVDSIYTGKEVTKSELERLVNGGAVQKNISQELTYKELYGSMDNIWSALFMTGYLTQRGESEGNQYNLVIPNQEIRNIITEHIMGLFKEDVSKDGQMVNEFCNALASGEADIVEKLFTEYMKKTIRVRDTFVRKSTKENFYHGILLGILSFKGGWMVKSNKEAGNGFSDIMIWMDDSDTGIVIEVKYAEAADMETECKKALEQIAKNQYEEVFQEEGIHRVLKYGIACNRKKCKVLMAK